MLYDTIKTLRCFTDKVIVSFSCGKDSIVTLDICMKHFSNVFVFFMYFVKGLEFQEAVLTWYEKRYGIEIYRIPHFDLSQMLRHGLFRMPDESVPTIGVNDVYAHIRQISGCEWIAAGERISDSIWRRAMIKHDGTIVPSRRRVYPVAYWNKNHIKTYIKKNRLKLPPEYKYFTSSFGGPSVGIMDVIHDKWQRDYLKIKEWFPFVGASLKQGEFYGEIFRGKTKEKQIPEV